MLRLLSIMVSIGLADSLNPSTVAPALFMTTLDRPIKRVREFTLGAFLVYFAGGLLIALGPGQLLLALVPHPSHRVSYILEIIAGAALLGGAALLIVHREHLATKHLPTGNAEGGRSSFVLGAGIMAVELPTALPYFAAIATVVGSGRNIPEQILAIFVFNVCFIAPMLGMLAVLRLWGDRAQAILLRVRDYIERRWPLILGVAALIAGAFVITLGATGLGQHVHGDIGRLSRRVRHLLPK